MENITIYGIPNCDSIKKTIHFLQAKKITFNFHDYKKVGITKSKLQSWCKLAGWETILNKKGTTWRKLDKTVQDKITNQASAIALMLEHNSLIKRPVIEAGHNIIIGFDETNITTQLKLKK